jgi:hypothetical protein
MNGAPGDVLQWGPGDVLRTHVSEARHGAPGKGKNGGKQVLRCAQNGNWKSSGNNNCQCRDLSIALRSGRDDKAEAGE